ncbi:MAG: nuclear transport factor 2 family protein [Actinomycetota bacterium]|nr:nuclear transport factor 2 family protein [Actinomycetota bacterium]
MSQENVDIVRRVFEAAAQRDAAAVSELYDADVEWDSSGTLPGEVESGGGARGYESLQAWFRQWHEAWDDVAYGVEELVDAGDQVVSTVTMRGRGRVSGLEVEHPQYAVWTIRDLKVVKVRWFRTREEAYAEQGDALRDLGVSKDAAERINP